MLLLPKVVLMLMLSVMSTKAIPIRNEAPNQIFAESYLTEFGYLPSISSVMSSSLVSIHDGITKFQAFAGLTLTGELNDETIEHMRNKRCGVEDVGGGDIVGGHADNVITTRHNGGDVHFVA